MPLIDEVRATMAKMSAAIAGGDAGAIAALYTEDVRLLANGVPRVDGRSGVEGFFKEAVGSGFNNMELETQEVTEAGELAIEVGHWTSTAFGGDAGNYVVVWKRESGPLKLHIDIFNSSRSPAPM